MNKNRLKTSDTKVGNDEVLKKDGFLCSWQKDKTQEKSRASDSPGRKRMFCLLQ